MFSSQKPISNEAISQGSNSNRLVSEYTLLTTVIPCPHETCILVVETR